MDGTQATRRPNTPTELDTQAQVASSGCWHECRKTRSTPCWTTTDGTIIAADTARDGTKKQPVKRTNEPNTDAARSEFQSSYSKDKLREDKTEVRQHANMLGSYKSESQSLSSNMELRQQDAVAARVDVAKEGQEAKGSQPQDKVKSDWSESTEKWRNQEMVAARSTHEVTSQGARNLRAC